MALPGKVKYQQLFVPYVWGPFKADGSWKLIGGRWLSRLVPREVAPSNRLIVGPLPPPFLTGRRFPEATEMFHISHMPRRRTGRLWSQRQIISGWTWVGQAWSLRRESEETIEEEEDPTPGRCGRLRVSFPVACLATWEVLQG